MFSFVVVMACHPSAVHRRRRFVGLPGDGAVWVPTVLPLRSTRAGSAKVSAGPGDRAAIWPS